MLEKLPNELLFTIAKYLCQLDTYDTDLEWTQIAGTQKEVTRSFLNGHMADNYYNNRIFQKDLYSLSSSSKNLRSRLAGILFDKYMFDLYDLWELSFKNDKFDSNYLKSSNIAKSIQHLNVTCEYTRKGEIHTFSWGLPSQHLQTILHAIDEGLLPSLATIHIHLKGIRWPYNLATWLKNLFHLNIQVYATINYGVDEQVVTDNLLSCIRHLHIDFRHITTFNQQVYKRLENLNVETLKVSLNAMAIHTIDKKFENTIFGLVKNSTRLKYLDLGDYWPSWTFSPLKDFEFVRCRDFHKSPRARELHILGSGSTFYPVPIGVRNLRIETTAAFVQANEYKTFIVKLLDFNPGLENLEIGDCNVAEILELVPMLMAIQNVKLTFKGTDWTTNRLGFKRGSATHLPNKLLEKIARSFSSFADHKHFDEFSMPIRLETFGISINTNQGQKINLDTLLLLSNTCLKKLMIKTDITDGLEFGIVEGIITVQLNDLLLYHNIFQETPLITLDPTTNHFRDFCFISDGPPGLLELYRLGKKKFMYLDSTASKMIDHKHVEITVDFKMMKKIISQLEIEKDYEILPNVYLLKW